MPKSCEIQCNKIATIREWEKLIKGKVSEVKPKVLEDILNTVRRVFKYDGPFDIHSLPIAGIST